MPPPFDRDPKATPKKDEKKANPEPPYVPTPQTVVDEMLKFAGVKEGDVVYDLGCGDGRIVVTAVKKFKAKKRRRHRHRPGAGQGVEAEREGREGRGQS